MMGMNNGICIMNALEATKPPSAREPVPAQSHEEDIEVPEGGFVRRIIVRIKLLPDSD